MIRKSPIKDVRAVNSRFCMVCSHPDRSDIEQMILNISPTNPSITLDMIANAYDIPTETLRVHALMHSPIVLDFDEESEEEIVERFKNRLLAVENPPLLPSATPSPENYAENLDPNSNSPATPATTRGRIADKVNMREGDLLLAAANEYFCTMSTLGRRLRRTISDNSDSSMNVLANSCTSAITNLYLGSGAEMRNAIKELNALNTSLNGPKDNSADGLKALANAISGSLSTASNNDNDETSTQSQYAEINYEG